MPDNKAHGSLRLATPTLPSASKKDDGLEGCKSIFGRPKSGFVPSIVWSVKT